MWPFGRRGHLARITRGTGTPGTGTPGAGTPGTGTPGAGRQTPPPNGPPFATRDGIWVRSLGEQRIADFLSRRRVRYEYEPRVVGLRPDFLLPDATPPVVIEYWGGAGFRSYSDRMVEKTARYEAAGYDVVHLVPLNLRELERVLRDELRARGFLD
jgi:hypothetical protein